ncbi:hypothetical protein [Prosthecobacter sp.]|uniref:hypothetical protein n=1 Tax=Prosthecobacter sp. TaxID=1965333 RepID=UPI0037843122
MRTLRHLLLAVVPVSALLVSCEPYADSRRPTVSQQDAYDVSWGLPPRKVRGNPKMRYQYNSRAEQTAAPVSPEPEAAAATPAPVLATEPARAAAPRATTVPPALR